MSESINIAKELISINSITPNDNGCLELIESQLKPIGFNLKRYDSNGVSNFINNSSIPWMRNSNSFPLMLSMASQSAL